MNINFTFLTGFSAKLIINNIFIHSILFSSMKKEAVSRINKKGLSQVIAITIIILLSLFAVAILWTATKTIIDRYNVGQTQEFLNCIQGANIQILDACQQNNLLKITIKNKRELILGDFFLVDITFNNGSVQRIPTPYHTYIGAYKTEPIYIPYKLEIAKIKVIPKIEEQAYLCPNEAPEYKGIISECV